MTISIGFADNTTESDYVLAFVKLADDRLYGAKRGGRNRVHAGFPPAIPLADEGCAVRGSLVLEVP